MTYKRISIFILLLALCVGVLISKDRKNIDEHEISSGTTIGEIFDEPWSKICFIAAYETIDRELGQEQMDVCNQGEYSEVPSGRTYIYASGTTLSTKKCLSGYIKANLEDTKCFTGDDAANILLFEENGKLTFE